MSTVFITPVTHPWLLLSESPTTIEDKLGDNKYNSNRCQNNHRAPLKILVKILINRCDLCALCILTGNWKLIANAPPKIRVTKLVGFALEALSESFKSLFWHTYGTRNELTRGAKYYMIVSETVTKFLVLVIDRIPETLSSITSQPTIIQHRGKRVAELLTR